MSSIQKAKEKYFSFQTKVMKENEPFTHWTAGKQSKVNHSLVTLLLIQVKKQEPCKTNKQTKPILNVSKGMDHAITVYLRRRISITQCINLARSELQCCLFVTQLCIASKALTLVLFCCFRLVRKKKKPNRSTTKLHHAWMCDVCVTGRGCMCDVATQTSERCTSRTLVPSLLPPCPASNSQSPPFEFSHQITSSHRSSCSLAVPFSHHRTSSPLSLSFILHPAWPSEPRHLFLCCLYFQVP